MRPPQINVSRRIEHNFDLFLVSVLGLFLELLLIRWIGTEVNIFAYLQNTILVVCFMGLGMGSMTSRQPIILQSCLVPLFVLVTLLAVPQTNFALRQVSLLLSTLGDLQPLEIITTANTGEWFLAVALGLAITFGILFLVWQIFVPIGRILGRLMDEHLQPIEAYSYNIFGSLIGIWIFVLLGMLSLPPWVWFLMVSALFLRFIMSWSPRRSLNLLILSLIASASWLGGANKHTIENLWSPYQKLVLTESDSVEYPSFKYFLTVNNSWYQGIQDLSTKVTQLNPRLYPQDEDGLSQYDLPFHFHPAPRKVLIVGAGTGNDVAGALRQGVADITAVEIDPDIIALGKKYHPRETLRVGKGSYRKRRCPFLLCQYDGPI